MMGSRWFSWMLAIGLFVFPAAPRSRIPDSALRAEPPPRASAVEDEDEEEEEEEGEDEPKLTERQKKVLDLFHASSKSFRGDRIVLEYDFESRNEDLTLDWLEGVDSALNSRIHWATRAEMEYVEDTAGSRTVLMANGAIVLADSGRWTHKAVFLPDLKMEVDLINVAHPRAGTVLGPAFYSVKKKTALCASNGNQPVCLKGSAIQGTPPKAEKPLVLKALQKIAYSYNGKVLEISRNGKKVCDTAQTPKVTEGFDTGHAAMAWTGSVKCFLAGVSISGRLDPDWVAKMLGEKAGAKTDANPTPKK